MTLKPATQTWKASALGGLEVMATLLAMLSPSMGGLGISLLLMAGGGNLDKRLVERWIRDVLATPSRQDHAQRRLRRSGGWVPGGFDQLTARIYDTMLAAPLIDENRFCLQPQQRSALTTSRKSRAEQGSESSRSPISVSTLKRSCGSSRLCTSGSYAEQDAALTLKLWQYFKIKMRQGRGRVHLHSWRPTVLSRPAEHDLARAFNFDRD